MRKCLYYYKDKVQHISLPAENVAVGITGYLEICCLSQNQNTFFLFSKSFRWSTKVLDGACIKELEKPEKLNCFHLWYNLSHKSDMKPVGTSWLKAIWYVSMFPSEVLTGGSIFVWCGVSHWV